MMSACLITEVPEFPPPERTPPFLIASTALPALNEIHLIRSEDISFEISAEVRSEDAPNQDNPEEGRVAYRLLVDYGRANGQAPYFGAPVTAKSLEAASFDVTGRRATAKWLRANNPISGCHTFTLIASHGFIDELFGCPEDLEDSSQLTWRVFVCDPNQECPPPEGANCPVNNVPIEPCYCPDDSDFDPANLCGAPL